MEKKLMCPRAEICPVYRMFIDATGDDHLGIVLLSTIENKEYVSCHALNTVRQLLKENKLSPEDAHRLEDLFNCLLIHEANKRVQKHRPDF